MEVYVRSLTGSVFRIDIEGSDSIWELKRLVNVKIGLPVEQQRLIFSGRLLEDHRTLSYYNITDGCNVHVVLNLKNQNPLHILNTYIDAIPIADTTSNPLVLQYTYAERPCKSMEDVRIISQSSTYQELYLRIWSERDRMYPTQPPKTSARQLKYKEIIRKYLNQFISTSDEPPKGWKKRARKAMINVLEMCGTREEDILLLKDTKIFEVADARKYIQQRRSELITPCSDLTPLFLTHTDVVTAAIIIPHFSLLDRMRFSLTCKTFNAMTRQPLVWRYLSLLHDRARVCDPHLINILTQYGTYIHALGIQKCTRLTGTSLTMIGDMCPNLRIFNAADNPFCDHIEQIAIFTKATKLQSINLSITTDYPLPKYISRINLLTELKELNIAGLRQRPETVITSATLKVLDVRYCNISKSLFNIDCPQLESLIVEEPYSHPKRTTQLARRYVSGGAGDPQSFVAISLNKSGSDEYYVQ